MPKYTGKTYSRARKREYKSSSKFDEVQNEETTSDDDANKNSKASLVTDIPRKSSWSRVHKAVAKTRENSPIKNSPMRFKKAKKLSSIDEHDPFAFTDEDMDSLSLPNSQANSQKSVEPSDKSTDDEAYSSSQELGESSWKCNRRRGKTTNPSSSPFKSFLKNNDKSLSPIKNKNLRRLSALPTNTTLIDEDLLEEYASEIPAVVRTSSWPTGKKRVDPQGVIKVKRKEKPLFTVIRNVKKMSECLESGEDQEFFDDIEYLLDGIQSSNLETRCLSALEVASRCTSASFRINLRAHGIIPKIFKHLHDAHMSKNLALCTAAIMYVLTQDKQNIDLDKFVLEMMMTFLSVPEVEEDSENSEDKKYKNYVQKARTMFEKHMNRIPGAYLDLKDISVLDFLKYHPGKVLEFKLPIRASSLARESLLSITSERAGTWFKQEIRTLGGLDHIVDAVSDCIDWLVEVHGSSIHRDQDSQAKIQRINKSLKLLENITYEDSANQKYLIQYKKGGLAQDLTRFTKLCVNTITEGSSAGGCSSSDLYIHNEATVEDCLFNVLKVFLNLSHDCGDGSNLIGQQENLLSSLLFCVLQLPQYLEASKRFDLHVLGLGLLINLVEHSKQNIATLVQLKTEPCHESQNTSNDSISDCDGQMGSIEALMQLFIVREKASRDTDQMTSALSPEDEDEEEVLRPTKDGLGWICSKEIDVSMNESTKNELNSNALASSSAPTCTIKDAKKNDDQNLEDEIGKALVIAGKHMEDSMVASYVALLLGCILQDNKANEALIRSLLPDRDFTLFVDVLKKFLGFMRLTSGTSGHAIEKILKVLQKCCEIKD